MTIVKTLVLLSFCLNFLFSLHLLFVKAGNRFLNRLLAVYFLSRTAENLNYFMIFNESILDFPYFLKLFIPLSYLGPAFFYVYLKGFVNDRTSFEKWDLIHLIPLTIALVDFLPVFFLSNLELNHIISQIVSQKSFFYSQRVGIFSGSESLYIRQSIFLVYLVFFGLLIKKTRIIQERNWKPVQNKWIIFISLSLFLLQILRFSVAYITDKFQNYSPAIISLTGILGAMLVIGLVLFLLYNPQILYGFIIVGRNESGSNTWGKNEIQSALQEKSRKMADLYSAEEIGKYKLAILQLFSDEKPFLNPDYRIAHIAEKLNIPLHHCSFVINYGFNKNFRDWINGYRIDYFIEHFYAKSDKMTIEAQAEEAGFSSAATFYNAFKKEKGTSPTLFFKQNKV
jgi:AraC-like DNA-binding protein